MLQQINQQTAAAIPHQKQSPALKVEDSHVYSFLTTYFLHQDRLSWNRIQTIVAVEATVLAASVAKAGITAILALAFGSLIVCLVWRLIKRDWQNRDQNLRLLDTVHKPLGIEMFSPAKSQWSRGSFIVSFLAYVVLIINGVLALIHVLVMCGVTKLNIGALVN